MKTVLLALALILAAWIILSPLALWMFKRREDKPHCWFEDVLVTIALPSIVVVCIYYFLSKMHKGQDIISW